MKLVRHVMSKLNLTLMDSQPLCEGRISDAGDGVGADAAAIARGPILSVALALGSWARFLFLQPDFAAWCRTIDLASALGRPVRNDSTVSTKNRAGPSFRRLRLCLAVVLGVGSIFGNAGDENRLKALHAQPLVPPWLVDNLTRSHKRGDDGGIFASLIAYLWAGIPQHCLFLV